MSAVELYDDMTGLWDKDEQTLIIVGHAPLKAGDSIKLRLQIENYSTVVPCTVLKDGGSARLDGEHVICKECGMPDMLHWFEEVKRKLIERQLCLICNHWYELALEKDNPNHVRANGVHYQIGEESAAGCREWRGFGGARFIIKFYDGREVLTTNLWSQGHIPEHFKDRLPDNAERVNG